MRSTCRARRIALVLVAVLVASGATGCSVLTGFGDFDFAAEPPDAGHDAAPSDLGPDDAQADAGPRDAGPRDAGPRDAGRDTGPDPAADAGADAGRDAGADAGPDAARDAGADTGPDAARDAGADAGPDASADAGSWCADDSRIRDLRAIESLPPDATHPGVTAYRIEYDVGGLRVFGQICAPDTPGRHPVIVYNHDGTGGLEGQWGIDTGFAGLFPNVCTYIARLGGVAVMAQYRGESDSMVGSGGAIEYCAGEVEDVETLAEIAMGRCDVDPTRIGVLGWDHGGCVALQMIDDGRIPIAAVAVFSAPTDLTALYRAWEGDMARDADLANLERWVGDPTTDAGSFDARSPLLRAHEIAMSGVPLMILHGGLDDVVPVAQACALRDAMASAGAGFSSFHLDALNRPITTPIPGCPGDTATYATTWPARREMRFIGPRYFVVWEQSRGAAALQALDVYVDFLAGHLGITL